MDSQVDGVKKWMNILESGWSSIKKEIWILIIIKIWASDNRIFIIKNRMKKRNI